MQLAHKKTNLNKPTHQKQSTRDLGQHIILLANRLNAGEFEFLASVREFDIRQGWKDCLFNNCAEWMNYFCGITLPTAREQ